MEEITVQLAAAVGEVGMAWGHSQRALLHCRRSGRRDLQQIVADLNRIGIELTHIQDLLRSAFEAAK